MRVADLEALYTKVMRPAPDLFTANTKFTLRVWDGMDGCWCDCVTGDKLHVLTHWAERTHNGTEKTKFADIDYYCIFPADTRMLWSGDNEMFR
jgi:hypothetical protein